MLIFITVSAPIGIWEFSLAGISMTYIRPTHIIHCKILQNYDKLF